MIDKTNGYHEHQNEILCSVEERDYWKGIATGLANAGFCKHCDSYCATELDNCPDKDNWHKYYNQLPEEFL